MDKKKKFKELQVGADAVDNSSAEYVRTRWKHYLRWLMFSVWVLLYLMLLLMSYNSHVLLHKGFLISELVGYIILMIMLIPVVPSLVLEVDYVKIEPEEVIFHNLLMRKCERWEDLVKFSDPRFLKFAIIRSKRFVYLLNRRDIPHFDRLLETIKEKAVNLKE